MSSCSIYFFLSFHLGDLFETKEFVFTGKFFALKDSTSHFFFFFFYFFHLKITGQTFSVNDYEFLSDHKHYKCFLSRIKNVFLTCFFTHKFLNIYYFWKLVAPKSINILESFGSLHFLASHKAGALERQVKYDLYYFITYIII